MIQVEEHPSSVVGLGGFKTPRDQVQERLYTQAFIAKLFICSTSFIPNIEWMIIHHLLLPTVSNRATAGQGIRKPT